MNDALKNARRIVVKVGSSLVTNEGRGVDAQAIGNWCRQLAALAHQGREVVMVSSGAIAEGMKRLGWAARPKELHELQAAAAVGQMGLVQMYESKLSEHGMGSAQVLLTHADLADRERYLNARSTLLTLLRLGVVPVINENDSVATEEIRFGDNDRLAARVAQAAGAQGVVLLSDVDGLYDRNPAHPDARHIGRVERIDAEVVAMADGGSASGMGSGGMVSKIAAARIAAAAGASLAIASGRIDRPLSTAARHTLFVAERTAPARKAWLAGGITSRGAIHVDAGAAAALERGRSLLAAGATRVEGRFARGDLVTIEGPAGTLARGLSEYDADDAARLIGHRSEEHEALLGYAPRSALVHRNHMALV